MGLLVDGKWQDQWYDTKSHGGKFVRSQSQFRHWIKADGSTEFQPEKDRYHLYVSYACPWAHRTIIFRKLKKLESVISLSVVNPYMLEHGWTFAPYPGSTGDPLNQKEFLYQIYLLADQNYSGRVTVPVLWDKKTGTIVNNESSEIIRMLNSEFHEFTDDQNDYCPQELSAEIDKINDLVYPNINNGVYKCGFATSQEAYEEAFENLFKSLDQLEKILSSNQYLLGNNLTEADWRFFTTLLRFDPVYYAHFKCNLRQISDYPHLTRYLKELYHHPGITETVNFDHIKTHYYASQKTINPSGITPPRP